MKTELSDHIYNRLLQEDWGKLPHSLKNGKTGISLFLALYSEVRQNQKARNLSTLILADALKEVNYLPCSFLDGKLGIFWELRYLVNKRILVESKEVEMHYAIGVAECMALRSSTPIQIIQEDYLFSTGIYMLQQNIQKTSLALYEQNERLIILLDECERLLKQNIKNIYAPQKMQLATLHSALYFLLEIDKLHIYPFQTKQLLAYIPELYKSICKDNLPDEYTLHFLMNAVATLPENLDESDLFGFMGNIGFYSILYNTPKLFYLAGKQAKKKYPTFFNQLKKKIKEENNVGALCGWGCGLLTLPAYQKVFN